MTDNSTTKRRYFLALVGIGAGAVLAGCSDDDDPVEDEEIPTGDVSGAVDVSLLNGQLVIEVTHAADLERLELEGCASGVIMEDVQTGAVETIEDLKAECGVEDTLYIIGVDSDGTAGVLETLPEEDEDGGDQPVEGAVSVSVDGEASVTIEVVDAGTIGSLHLGGCTTGYVASDIDTGDIYAADIDGCQSGETLEIIGKAGGNEQEVGSATV